MSLFKKLFGPKTSAPVGSTATPVDASAPATAASAADVATTVAAAGPPPPTADPSKDPNMIRVFDPYGREMFIPRQQWRDHVLLSHLKKVWNEPDPLYGTIVQALNDGFLPDMIEPAEHLATIDPNAERSATLLAIVYRESQRLDDSSRILLQHIEQHGESGVILTNLAKVQAAQGDDTRSLDTLWRALERDPNQENSLGWFEAVHREKDGPAAGLAALRRLAALPGSWRARLWLARDALGRRELDEAKALYDEALSLAGQPVPGDLLMQMSGDLGNAAHLPEILALVAPHFDIAVHGLQVGNNLLKANLDLGRLDAARALLDRLYAQQRPDWKPHLDFWDTEIARARVGTTVGASDTKFQVAMLTGDGPVWLPPDSAGAELFPVPSGECLRIAFLGSSAGKAADSDPAVAQLSDAPGRLSRALPLFLAEQVCLHGRAQVRPLVPWVRGDTTAFVLCALAWKDDDAAQHARHVAPPTDYVVVTHLQVAAEPWRVELRLIRTIDAAVLGRAEAEFPSAQPEAALRGLAAELLQLLQQEAGFEPVSPPVLYRVPTGDDFAHYLLRLEQLLAVRCYSADTVSASELHGEREIIDGNIHLCLASPDNVVTRLLLAQILQRMKKVRPEVVAEYREKIQLLQKENPLPDPAQGVLQRILAAVYP